MSGTGNIDRVPPLPALVLVIRLSGGIIRLVGSPRLASALVNQQLCARYGGWMAQAVAQSLIKSIHLIFFFPTNVSLFLI